MNPAVNQTANATQQASALANLQRLFGIGNPQVNMVAPSSGPYNWPGQAEIMPQSHALDGSALGGINLGYVDSIYGQHPGDQAAADARVREIFGSRFQNPQGPAATPQVSQAMPTASPQGPQAGVRQQPSLSNLSGGGGLPPSFAQDLMGNSAPKMSGNMPAPQPQVPQTSAFAPAQGQNMGMGMNQLQQVIQALRAKGLQI